MLGHMPINCEPSTSLEVTSSFHWRRKFTCVSNKNCRPHSSTGISVRPAGLFSSRRRGASNDTSVNTNTSQQFQNRSYLTLFNLLYTLVILEQFKCGMAQSFRKVHLGFPEAWDGDKYRDLHCPSKDIPKFLDGYFLCQLSASYGNSKAPPGQRLNHMIDAIGAIGSFHISEGQVSFSAQYYPARPYKIWEFYDRNMSKASVPWAGWSDYNLTAMAKWDVVPNNIDSARFHPNLDFWRVGTKLIAGTEAPYWVGYEFDVRALDKFKLFPFIEDNEIFGNPRPNMTPISMAIHERTDPADGTLWGSFSAMNFNEQRFFQGIFTVDTGGVRRVVGMYDYGVYDGDACSKDDEYIGDKTQLPGYIHSITSTENFIILPVTSLLINPCKFKEPPLSNPHSDIQSGGLWGMDFYEQKPLEVFPSMFITHQLNAFESLDGSIVADMVVYDSHDPYVKYFYTDFLTSQVYPSTARILRFTLDIREFKVMYSYLIPQETIAADFPQVNHLYDARPYQWAYLVEHPFAADNAILKVNVDDPAGARNIRFKSDASLVLHEPWVVSKPDALREDDAVLIIRALDLSDNKGVLLIVDANSMTEIGRAHVPISIPFGFHNRFFSNRDLGLPSTFVEPQVAGMHGFAGNRGGNTDRSSAFIRRGGRPNRNRKPHSWRPYVPPQPYIPSGEGPPRTTHAFWNRILTTTTVPSPTWVPVHPVATDSSIPWWLTTASPPPPSPPTIPPYISPHMARPSPYSRPFSQKIGVSSNTQQGGGEVRKNGDTLTVRQLYEKMLSALCNWLPKIFKNVTFDGCVDSGKQAVRWMSPIAASYTDKLHVTSDEETDEDNLENELLSKLGQRPDSIENANIEGREMGRGEGRAPQTNRLRPILQPKMQMTPAPWYNYRTYAKPAPAS
ncbi:retinal pigment epithelial membrane protein domain-containing protein [Ditylenchus destructor]|uniref:Retinal pigment epithelial membrane protein domain-containing protein n=1 Tax=Ditylenchus destructor TaxID=166010 RepID=A0AAD4N1Q8_9BILA|nr:retinal pigment epithelial membrane protein domain-containing protein [Ditylenchus destructor]